MSVFTAGRGFLPLQDPLTKLPNEFDSLETLAKNLPAWVDDKTFRERAAQHLKIPHNDLWTCVTCENHRAVERLMMLYSYFASAWVHGHPEPTSSLPYLIGQPLVYLAKTLGRPPILAYANYCLTNWERIDPEGPIALGNIRLLQNFTAQGKRDEDWFILVHVDIEQKAAKGVEAIRHWLDASIAANADRTALTSTLLESLLESLSGMNQTMARMPEQCSPDVYFKLVRPYIFGFNQIRYMGCFDNQPQSYRGETGAQSSIVPLFLAVLGVKHEDSMLTRHLKDMLSYMPAPHRKILSEYVISARSYVEHKYGATTEEQRSRLIDLYNACLESLIEFRTRHFKYAVDYIEKKVTNPTGTGGTPYVEWLGKLIDETKKFFIKRA
jgi:indoleamine 2,3-dioxygenase